MCIHICKCNVHFWVQMVHGGSWRLPSPDEQVTIDCQGGGGSRCDKGKAKLYILDKCHNLLRSASIVGGAADVTGSHSHIVLQHKGSPVIKSYIMHV